MTPSLPSRDSSPGEQLPRLAGPRQPRTPEQWEELFSATPASPPYRGRVAGVCVRPDLGTRAFPEILELDPEWGARGDRWKRRTWKHLADGRPDPRVQVAVMSRRMLEFLWETTHSRHHPGDTLVVDLALDQEILPTGTRLAVGTAEIEVSDVENDGCAKFGEAFGSDVLAWLRTGAARRRRLRGLFAQVVTAGEVKIGDEIFVRTG